MCCTLDFEFSVPKTRGTIQTFISDRSKSQRLSWYGVQQSKQHGWLGYVRRCHWNGSIETYTAIKRMSFMGSPLLLYQDNASLILMCYCTTAGFRRPSECPRLASRSVSYWKRMAHHEKTKTITDCWATEVLYQARLDKNVACRIKKLVSSIPKHWSIVIKRTVDVTPC